MKTKPGLLLFLLLLLGQVGWVRKQAPPEKREAVPLARLIHNFTRLHESSPTNVEPIYWLARLHAFAYATNPPFVMVGFESRVPDLRVEGWDPLVPGNPLSGRSNATEREAHEHLKEAIDLYERAADLIRTSTASSNRTDLALTIQFGRAWCLHQVGRTNAALLGYREVLRATWEDEVVRVQKEDAEARVRRESNPDRTDSQDYPRLPIGPGYSGAILGFMLELLDPVQDASEVRKLRQDLEAFRKIPRAPADHSPGPRR